MEKLITIDPNEIKTRDYHMLMIIGGATKAYTQTDRKKQANKEICRKKVDRNFED